MLARITLYLQEIFNLVRKRIASIRARAHFIDAAKLE